MRLAASNIAWAPSEDDEVADLLVQRGIDAIELAPSRSFPDPAAVDPATARSTAVGYADRGLEVVAFQSLLFGRPDLTLFEGEEARVATLVHLTAQLRLAGAMGVRRLVFGSPKNRRVPDGLAAEEAWRTAVAFFRAVAAVAEGEGTVLCIEPNPAAYDCNFVTTAAEGAALVREVDRAGFGLHLDAAGMTLAGEDPASSVRATGPLIRHYHASAPQLGELEDEVVDHAAARAALRKVGYDGVVSIEMRPGPEGTNRARVDRAVSLAQRRYGD